MVKLGSLPYFDQEYKRTDFSSKNEIIHGKQQDSAVKKRHLNTGAVF
jgi:hypothetical protein